VRRKYTTDFVNIKIYAICGYSQVTNVKYISKSKKLTYILNPIFKVRDNFLIRIIDYNIANKLCFLKQTKTIKIVLCIKLISNNEISS